MFYSTRHFIRIIFIVLLLYILGRGIAWERVRIQAGHGLQKVERAVSSAGRKAAQHVDKAQRSIRKAVERYLR